MEKHLINQMMNKINKEISILTLIANMGMVKIYAHFDGGGDSGWVDDVSLIKHENNKEVYTNASDHLDKKQCDQLENFTCELILKHADTVADIVNNDGGSADLHIDLLNMNYKLEVTERVTEYNDFEFEENLKEHFNGTS